METLLPAAASYTVVERANRIYNGVLDIFDYNASNDVTTPLELARHQVRQIPTRSGNVLIPGAGIGTYVLACLLEGFTPGQITAVELNSAYSRLGFGVFSRFGVTYLHNDYLTFNSPMKFDVIIGNPPYQDSSTDSKDKKLWTRFVEQSLDLLEVGGSLVFVTPNSLVGRTQLPAKRRELLSSKYSLDWIDHTAGSYFPQVGVDICSWCVTNKPYAGKTSVIDDDNTRVVDLREELPIPLSKKINDDLAEKIYSNIGEHGVPELVRDYNDVDQTPAEDGKYINYQSGRNKFFRTNDTCKNTGKLKVVFSFSATYKQWFITTQNVSGSNLYVEVSSVEEGLAIGNSLMHPVVMFYVDTWRRTAGYCPAIKNNGALPDVRNLSDEEIIKKFKLTDEEYSYIMNSYVPYKSTDRVLL